MSRKSETGTVGEEPDEPDGTGGGRQIEATSVNHLPNWQRLKLLLTQLGPWVFEKTEFETI